MKYSVFTAAAASAALLVSGPVLAQQRGNGQQTREQARDNSQGRDNASERGVERSNENSVLKDSRGDQSGGSDMQNRDKRRGNSQGRDNASDRDRDRGNQNRSNGVRSGMTVQDGNGKTVGRVKDVKRAPDGTIIAIIVVLVVQINGGSTITLTPGSFTIVNNIIVTTQIAAPSGS